MRPDVYLAANRTALPKLCRADGAVSAIFGVKKDGIQKRKEDGPGLKGGIRPIINVYTWERL